MIHKSDYQVLVIATTKDTAKNIITKIQLLYDKLPSWYKAIAPQTIENKLEFGLSNGSIVKAAASTEKSARSPSLSLLVFDECAHIENFDDIWTAASATLSCVDYNTIITTDSGLYRIGDLKSDDMKYGFNDHQLNIINKDGEVELSDSYYISEPSDVIEVFFKSGTSITITKNHPLMTNGGWAIGENLKIGDLIHKRFNTQSFGKLIEYPKFKLYSKNAKSLNNNISNLDLAYFYGLYIAEGNRGSRKNLKNPRISITNTDSEIISFLTTKFGFRLVDDRHLLLSCQELSEYMKYVGIDYSTAKFKKIPNKILSASQEEQVSFLQGLFDGDGSAHTVGGTITYTSASKQLIYDVYTMLLNFGIKSKIKYTESNSPKSSVVKHKDLKYVCYKLSIYGKNARKYFNDIGFRLTRKQGLQNNFKNGDYIIVDKNVVKSLILKSGFTLTNFKLNVVNVTRLLYSGAESITEDSLEKILENTNKNTDEWNILNNILEKHNNTFEYFDEIIKIENAGYKETYDLKVPKSHSFLANNIISHNTGGDSILLSSPNGMGGKFHSIWVKAEEGTTEDGLDPFNAIRLDWRVHPERDDAWAAREKDKLGAREFSQEHEVNFLTSGHTVVESEILEWIRDKMVCEPIEKRYSGDLWIWEYPNYVSTFVLSADVARGDGSDYSAFSVFDVETSKQVASYKAKIGTREYARLLVAVATEYNNALLVVDNRNAGWDTVQEIINLGYDNLFYTYRNDPYFDPNIQLKKRYDLVDNKDKTPGLSTTERVRQVMMSKLEMNVNAKEVLIRDLRTLNELNVFLWVHGKPQAQNGSNDDLVSALAMYLFVRDTAIRMHEMGIQLSKKALQNTHKSVYKPQRFNDPYNLKIGNNENFDLRDLLPKK